jgi:hypothetical protein
LAIPPYAIELNLGTIAGDSFWYYFANIGGDQDLIAGG